jgi:hypothetical protein
VRQSVAVTITFWVYQDHNEEGKMKVREISWIFMRVSVAHLSIPFQTFTLGKLRTCYNKTLVNLSVMTVKPELIG